MEIRKAALRLLIVSIVASGLFAIAVLVTGEFGRLEAKVLLSALSISGASICGMACGAAWDRGLWRQLATLGIAITLATLALSLVSFWIEPEPIETWVQAVATGWCFSIAAAHGCLLALARTDRVLARIRWASLALGFVLAAGLSLPLWTSIYEDEAAYYRWLGVVAVLMLMGSLSLPVLGRLWALPAPEDADAEPPEARVMCPACGNVQTAALGRVRCTECGASYRIEID